MALLDIPHVVDAWTEMELMPDGSMEFVTVVVTDLELNAGHQKHNKPSVDALQVALSAHVRNPYHVGKIRLTTKRS